MSRKNEAEFCEGQQPLPIDPGFVNFDEVTREDYSAQVWFRLDATLDKLKLLEVRIEESKIDSLTGLAGRGAFEEYLERYILEQEGIENRLSSSEELNTRRGDVTSQGLALLFIDLDKFKAVNDTFGHDAGDQVLVSTARVLEGVIRDKDVAARLGGDEFVVLLNQGIDEESAQVVADRVRRGVGEIPVNGEPGHVGASIGLAIYQPGTSLEALLKSADSNMYKDKTRQSDGEGFVG